MTNQEVFDKVWDYFLVKKNPQAFVEKGDLPDRPNYSGCMYRTPDGCKCALGCLIPDEVYSPEMEGDSGSAVIADWPRVAAIFDGVDTKFLDELQSTHDDAERGTRFRRTFKKNLKELADAYELVVPQ